MKNQIAALAGKIVELNKMVESWKNKYQKSVEECDNIQKQLDAVRKENGKLSNDNQRLQEISDRYDRVVRILGMETVEDCHSANYLEAFSSVYSEASSGSNSMMGILNCCCPTK